MACSLEVHGGYCGRTTVLIKRFRLRLPISILRNNTYIHALDMTQMQEAIQSGRNEAVDDLLRGMTKPQQKMQLCATYGGSEDSPGSPDANDLYVRTSPMLHAARCGNSEAFSTLLHAARGMLKSQVGRALVKKALSSGRSFVRI